MISRILPLLTTLARNNSAVFNGSVNAKRILQKMPVYYQASFSRAFSGDESSSSSSDEEEMGNIVHVNNVMLTGTIRNIKKREDRNDFRIFISVKRANSDVSDYFSVIVGDQIRRRFLNIGELLTVEGTTYKYKNDDGIFMQDIFATRIVE